MAADARICREAPLNLFTQGHGAPPESPYRWGVELWVLQEVQQRLWLRLPAPRPRPLMVASSRLTPSMIACWVLEKKGQLLVVVCVKASSLLAYFGTASDNRSPARNKRRQNCPPGTGSPTHRSCRSPAAPPPIRFLWRRMRPTFMVVR